MGKCLGRNQPVSPWQSLKKNSLSPGTSLAVQWLRICLPMDIGLIPGLGFPGSSDSKESPFNAEDTVSIQGSRRSSGEGNGYPLQYSCLENSMDRGAWWATVYGVTKSWT